MIGPGSDKNTLKMYKLGPPRWRRYTWIKEPKNWRALLILALCLYWEIHSQLRFALSVCSCQANCILSVFLLLLNPAHSRDHYIALTNSCQGKKYSWSWFYHWFTFKEGIWCHIKFGENCKKYSRSWFFRSKTCSMAYMTKFVGYYGDWKKQICLYK